MKISAVKCPKCKDIIYSRARHDMRACSCEDTTIDGGFDYCKVGFIDATPEIVQLDLEVTKAELYHDWNTGTDKYGIIKEKN